MPRFSLLILLIALLCGCAAPIPTAIDTPASTPTFTPLPPTQTPTETLTLTSTPEPAWQTTLESQDPQGKFLQIENGQPTIDLYDTQTQEKIVLNQETIKITTTTDILNPNILTAQDADGNTYAFNPNYGWFKVPEVQMGYANLPGYTEVYEDSYYDGQHSIIRALSYANSPDKINTDGHHVFWVTARGNNLLCLSFFPVGRTGEAQRLWPEEYKKTWEEYLSFVFSGYYKVNLKVGGYIYVIDRTIKIDDTHTSGLSNGFDPTRWEAAANRILGDGSSGLKVTIEGIIKGGYDLVTILPPPERLADGTLISFDPNNAVLKGTPSPIVAGLQGPRGSLISLFSQEDQQRILDVLAAHQHESNDIVNPITAPLTDPSQLAKLANHILLSDIASP
jgi:PBP1b-binding outer membrane lipoprotein LpoB